MNWLFSFAKQTRMPALRKLYFILPFWLKSRYDGSAYLATTAHYQEMVHIDKTQIPSWFYIVTFCFMFLLSQDTAARNHVSIVGSSTVFPLVAAAAEQYHKRHPNQRAPVVESTGTGSGFQAFCRGTGIYTPDIVNSSRGMSDSEKQLCQSNSVDAIDQIQIGSDGISLVQNISQNTFMLTSHQLALALAKFDLQSPSPNLEKLNPIANWSEIGKGLPKREIRFFGPPPGSGTRDLLVAILLKPLCNRLFSNPLQQDLCAKIRTDHHFQSSGERDHMTIKKIKQNQEAVGIIGFSFLQENRHAIQAISIDGFLPNVENIQNRHYKLSRPLFLFIKRVHLSMTHGLLDFLEFLTTQEVLGKDGALQDYGLIPLNERFLQQQAIKIQKAALELSNGKQL